MEQELETGKNLSQLFQDYYSAVTSHFTHCGDRELVGWRTAKGFCRKHTQQLSHAENISIFDSGKIMKWKIKDELNGQLVELENAIKIKFWGQLSTEHLIRLSSGFES